MKKPNLYLSAWVRMLTMLVGFRREFEAGLELLISESNRPLVSDLGMLITNAQVFHVFPCFKLFSLVSLYLPLAMGGKGGRRWTEAKLWRKAGVNSASISSFTKRVNRQLLPCFLPPVTDVKACSFSTCTNKVSIKMMDSFINLVGMKGSFLPWLNILWGIGTYEHMLVRGS